MKIPDITAGGQRLIRLLLVCLAFALAPSARAGERSAGLFIGIGKFDFQAGLAELEYAPDDAVALAYRFVAESRQMAPGDAQIILAGEPRSPLGRQRLAELKSLGVGTVKGTRSGLRKSLEKFSRKAANADLAVVSFSGHGYETEKGIHLMPSDGNWQTVRTTGVSLEFVLQALETTRAKSKLLLFDACRQVPDMVSLDRGAADQMFRERVRNVPGLVTLASCSAGEKSWQAKTLEQGVFTHLVLQELKNDEKNAWSQLGERVVRANERWFQKHEIDGPKAWFNVGGR